MYTYPDINKIILTIFNIKIYWYGILYFISILLTYILLKKNIKELPINIHELLIYILISVIFGGKIGIIIYDNSKSLISLLKFWEPGRSFYGGLIIFIIIIAIKLKNKYLLYFKLSDILVKYFPLSIFLCRIGNFINGESYGNITNNKIGIIFPSGGPYLRHPTQLYESLTEGLMIFFIIILFKKDKPGLNTDIFSIVYGFNRFIIENLKHQYYIFNLPIYKVLSLSMFFFGIVIYISITNISYKKHQWKNLYQ